MDTAKMTCQESVNLMFSSHILLLLVMLLPSHHGVHKRSIFHWYSSKPEESCHDMPCTISVGSRLRYWYNQSGIFLPTTDIHELISMLTPLPTCIQHESSTGCLSTVGLSSFRYFSNPCLGTPVRYLFTLGANK